MAEKIHPATTITNIKLAIPLTLDYESAQYNNWATLFTIHTQATLTHDHITPITSSVTRSAEEQAQWVRIDNIVRQWIYGTISNDLLNTIINPTDTALDAWNHLADLFQDNKTARVIHLETKFANTHLQDFPDAKAHTRRLKVLADQLANVGEKVYDQRMVLRLLTGLTDVYEGFVTVVQNKVPLPTFSQARLMLLLEETTKAEHAKSEATSNSAMLMKANFTSESFEQPKVTASSQFTGHKGKRHQGKQKGVNYQRGNQNHGGGRGQSRTQQQPSFSQQQSYMQQPGWNFSPWNGWYSPQPWMAPPCPYPTNSWAPCPQQTARQQGVLGPHPTQ
ncbi:uncharacterized protein LOC105629881 [Jatropha curcas]|uniref:uncharacterized protein LOC105629881 n=1 Tax=Jatropha curcas TaxID=180498 RepID=UPI0005FC34DF|nr:uncharacterized protein LOC105629881 [Jatropha curcas]